MYEYYNPNPMHNKVGDCVIRAISKAFAWKWDKVYCEICAYGFDMKDMPSANRVWGRMLSEHGYKRQFCKGDSTVKQFCDDHPQGTYILALQSHVVCVIDGIYYDSWDSGDEEILYYWEEK